MMTHLNWSTTTLAAAKLVFLAILCTLCFISAATAQPQGSEWFNNAGEVETKQGLSLASRETNAFNFVRLLIQRLIYGFASMIGLGDAAEEFAGGALVPPGVDDYGFGIEGTDNKDYDDDDDYKENGDDGGYDDYIY